MSVGAAARTGRALLACAGGGFFENKRVSVRVMDKAARLPSDNIWTAPASPGGSSRKCGLEVIDRQHKRVFQMSAATAGGPERPLGG